MLTLCAFADEKGFLLHHESFANDHHLSGVMSSFSEYFHTGDWEFFSGSLTLVYSSTPLVRPDVSDFTISLNGIRFYSQKIPESSGEVQRQTISLPAYAIKSGTNVLTFESYVRTSTDSNICQDDFSNADWLNLMKDSSVSIQYQPHVSINSAANLYNQLTSIDALENGQTAVIVPEGPTEEEMTVAGLILTGIVRNAELDSDRIKFFAQDDFSIFETCRYSVYIADFNRLDTLIKLKLSDEQKLAAETQAAVVMLEVSDSHYVLVVTGRNPTAMLNAGRLFGNQALFQQTITSWRKISAADDFLMPEISPGTQKPLTPGGTYLHGPFRQAADFYIRNPSSQMIAPGSSVTLSFRHSDNLDFSRSLVTVYAADIPIGSTRLTQSTSQGQQIMYTLPDDIQASGTLKITVAFDLVVKDLQCTVHQEQMPWAYISSDSFVNLITKPGPGLILEHYPAPFVENDLLNGVTMVLPVNYSETDLNIFRSILLNLGKSIRSNRGSFSAVFTDNLTDLSDTNLIVIGSYIKNPIAQRMNSQLFFEFSFDGATIVSNEKTRIDPAYGATLGNIELLDSPYSSSQHALLLISGAQDQGCANGAAYFSSEKALQQLHGDGCLADRSRIDCYRFKPAAENAEKTEEPPASRTFLTKYGWAGGAAAGLLMILTGLLQMRRLKKKKKKSQNAPQK